MWQEWLARMMKDPAATGCGPASSPLRDAGEPMRPGGGGARPEAERPPPGLAEAPAAG
jgi:hypothetical protein